MPGTFDDIIRQVLGIPQSRSEFYPAPVSNPVEVEEPLDFTTPLMNVKPSTAQVPADSMLDVIPVSEGVGAGPAPGNAVGLRGRHPAQWQAATGDANAMLQAMRNRQRLGRSE